MIQDIGNILFYHTTKNDIEYSILWEYPRFRTYSSINIWFYILPTLIINRYEKRECIEIEVWQRLTCKSISFAWLWFRLSFSKDIPINKEE